MEDKSVFFGETTNIAILKKFRRNLNNLDFELDFEKARNNHIDTIINSMINTSSDWDKFCKISINWIGGSFIDALNCKEEDLNNSKLDYIFSYCYRFLIELYLSISSSLSMDFEAVRSFGLDSVNSFSDSAKEHIMHTLLSMPIAIFKSIANSESIVNLRDFNSLANAADKKKQEVEDDLTKREERVNVLRDALSKYETGFNFVGLYDGFDGLAKEKEIEKKSLLFWLKIFGSIILVPFVAQLTFILSHLNITELQKTVYIFSFIPSISLMVIFIYYFRIILQDYKSVKSQILQLDLRKTLCQFIQHYSEYSSKVKTKDKDALEKFENIIFSGLVSDSEKLPSTFDGIDQISQLIKSFK